MTKPGIGDEGLAEDLLALAEVDIEPRADWGPVVRILGSLEGPSLVTAAERRRIIADARDAAGKHAALNRLIDTYESDKR